MIKKIIIGIISIFTLIAVISCGQKKAASDGYYFEQETFVRTDIQVNIVLVKNQEEMTKLLAEHHRSVSSGNEVAAFSVLEVSEPNCTIYMIDPKTSYQPEFIGHELVHCVYGDWHKSQP